MDVSRLAVAATVVIIVGAAVVSGPLVDGIDLTPPASGSQAAPGTGELDVRSLSAPDSAALVKGEYGSGTYYLRVADATIDVVSVTGQPLLVYKLAIPELGYVRGTTHFMNADTTGPQRIELQQGTVDPDKVRRDRYPGKLRLIVRDDRGERTLHAANVTVHVED